MDHLCKLVKEAEECSVVLNCDIVGATLNYRTAAAKDWLSRCRQVCSKPTPLLLDTSWTSVWLVAVLGHDGVYIPMQQHFCMHGSEGWRLV